MNNKILIKKCEYIGYSSHQVWYSEIELIQAIDNQDDNQLFDEMNVSYDEDFEDFLEGDEFYSFWNCEDGSYWISKELEKEYLNK